MTATAEHVGMADNVLLCEHCGSRQELTLPQPVDSVVALMRAWTKAHKKCRATPGVSAFRHAKYIEQWPTSDDTGLSSCAIYNHMRHGLAPRPNHPWDPSDFGRCYRLLALAPDWRARIGELARYGKVWGRLSAAWDELTTLYEAEVDVSVTPHRAKANDGLATRLYMRMKEIIDGKKTQLSEYVAPNEDQK